MPNRYVPILQEHAPPSVFDLDKLIDEGGVLTIQLLDEGGRRIGLRFDDYLAYRKRDEGNALSALNDASTSTSLGRSFYRVEESEFLAWFEAESYGMHQGSGLTHLAIMTIDDIIDVICRKLPLIVLSSDR